MKNSLLISIFFTFSTFSLQAQVANVYCNNSGTLPNKPDDYISFTLNPPPPSATFISPFTYSISAVQNGNATTITFIDGTPAVNIPYGTTSSFKLPGGSSGAGNVTLTVTPNFSGYSPVNYTVTDPGDCAVLSCPGSGTGTVSYTYVAPIQTLELNNLPAYLPKFHTVSDRTLTKATLTFQPVFLTTTLIENNSASSNNFIGTVFSEFDFSLNGSVIGSSTASYTTGLVTLPKGIHVSASGIYPGDSANSTLLAMPWTNSVIAAGLNPRVDPRWVTNAVSPANASLDADIFYSGLQTITGTPIVNTYTSANAEFDNFKGAGFVPFSASTLTGEGFSGGGGNLAYELISRGYYNITVQYQFSCTAGATLKTDPVLPVTMLSFSGNLTNGKVALNWETADEVNTKLQIIERSTDAISWTDILTVAPKKKSVNQYIAFDSFPNFGQNYYRLKVVDIDGTYRFGNTISIKNNAAPKTAISFYPNPAATELRINVPATYADRLATLLSTDGKIIWSKKLAPGINYIDVQRLNNGLYFFKTLDANNTNNIQKIMISH